MKPIEENTIKELVAMGYRVELHAPLIQTPGGLHLHVQEPDVSTNRGQGNLTNKGKNK